MKAAHGVGKTFLATIVMFQHLYCFNNSLVACTAPTKHQLSDVLWTEAARFMSRSKVLDYFFTWTATRIQVKGKENIWHALAIPSSNPNALAGLHEKNLCFILDEGPGIKESAFPVMEGALTGINNKVMMIGNPVRVTGFFHDVFQRPQGWGTFTMSRLKSQLSDLDPKYPERIALRFGENSNIYRVRVLGEFPKGEDDSILDIDLVTEAMHREEPGERLEVREGGCDVARYGSDRTEIYIRYGYEIADHVEIFSSDTVEVQNAIMRLIRKHGLSAFKIDAGTFGAGVVDNVIKLCREAHVKCNIIGVYNNQKAVNEKEYENAGTEMYFGLREVLKVAKIPDDDELLGELTLRKYRTHTVSQRLVIQDKEELRKDMVRQKIEGFKSPDKADALALTFYAPKKTGTGKARAFKSEEQFKDFF